MDSGVAHGLEMVTALGIPGLGPETGFSGYPSAPLPLLEPVWSKQDLSLDRVRLYQSSLICASFTRRGVFVFFCVFLGMFFFFFRILLLPFFLPSLSIPT